MTEPERRVSSEEARPYLEKILSSNAFVGASEASALRRSVMEVLFAEWERDRTTVMPASVIAGKLGMSIDVYPDATSATRVRQAVEIIRKLLRKYYQQNPNDTVIFDLPFPESRRSYRLVIHFRQPKPSQMGPTILTGGNAPKEILTAAHGAGDRIFIEGVSELLPGLRDTILEDGVMDQLGRVYLAQHQQSHLNYSRCGFVAKARCLLDETEAEFGMLDLVHYRAEFKTLQYPVYCRCLSVTVGMNRNPPAIISCDLFNLEDGERITTFAIPVRSRKLATVSEWLVFFDPVLPPCSGPYRLDCQYLVDEFMRSLKEVGRDELTFALRRKPEQKAQVDLVLHLPARYSAAKMLPRSFPQPGRQMTERELSDYGPSPPNFRSLGWTDMEPGQKDYGVDITLR